jgi:FkbM family methyltransferase
MTDEQLRDETHVWEEVGRLHPYFTRAHDPAGNYHAVREIVLGGSLSWAGVHQRFQPGPDSLVMDVGANVGIYTAYCALRGAHVVAYEPFDTPANLLEKMVKANGLDHLVTLVNAAISTFTGECPYFGNLSHLDGACPAFNGGLITKGVYWTEAERERSVLMPCVSLDDAIGERTWDCVKIDIEGAEAEVLLAASSEALHRIRFMYVEFHPWIDRETYDRMIWRLRDLYRFEGITKEGVISSDTVDRYEAGYCTKP